MRARTQRLKFSVQIIRVVEKRWKDVTEKEREVLRGKERNQKHAEQCCSLLATSSRAPHPGQSNEVRRRVLGVQLRWFSLTRVYARDLVALQHITFRVNISVRIIYRDKYQAKTSSWKREEIYFKEIEKQPEGERDRKRLVVKSALYACYRRYFLSHRSTVCAPIVNASHACVAYHRRRWNRENSNESEGKIGFLAWSVLSRGTRGEGCTEKWEREKERKWDIAGRR